jgi:hypothetical protein
VYLLVWIINCTRCTVYTPELTSYVCDFNPEIVLGHKYHIKTLNSFFWVISRRLNFLCRRFGTHCQFHLHRRCPLHQLWRWNWQSVPKGRHIKFRQGITQKKEFNVQNRAKVWKQEWYKYIYYSQKLQICHLNDLKTNTRTSASLSGRYPRVL